MAGVNTTATGKNPICPCCSGKPYAECCKILHEGGYAENGLLLMRSRYSAYAKQLPHYIIRTTHPLNPHYKLNHTQWAEEILDFCKNTEFIKLEIVDFLDGPDISFVTFIAHLKQNHIDQKLIEKSQFQKVGPQWLYLNGTHPQ